MTLIVIVVVLARRRSSFSRARSRPDDARAIAIYVPTLAPVVHHANIVQVAFITIRARVRPGVKIRGRAPSEERAGRVLDADAAAGDERASVHLDRLGRV